jgi:hypothetical protein
MSAAEARGSRAASHGAQLTAAAGDAEPRRSLNLSLWNLEPTWPNAEMLLHRLWGQASVGDYRKDEWSAYLSLVQRLRETSTEGEREICDALLQRNVGGVFRWLRDRVFPQ